VNIPSPPSGMGKKVEDKQEKKEVDKEERKALIQIQTMLQSVNQILSPP
jgi:hypothetical protein